MDHDAEPTTPSTERPAGLPDPYTFCSCGRTGCPGISTDSEGNVVVNEDAVAFIDVGEDRRGIVFKPDQARELKIWLEQHGF